MNNNHHIIYRGQHPHLVFSKLPDENQKSINANKGIGIYFAGMINKHCVSDGYIKQDLFHLMTENNFFMCMGSAEKAQKI